MTLNAVLERLRERAEADPAFEDALEHLARGDGIDDPFAQPPPATRRVAREVNRRRQADRIDRLRERSLTTAQVVDLLGTVSDRRAVDRRRARGTLLGIPDGNRTLHPAWQFDRRRGEVYEGLDRVLSALTESAFDEIDADAIAVAPRPEAGGASVADLLAEGDVDGAIALARLAGDQS